MTKVVEFWLIQVVVGAAGIAGAIASKYVQRGGHWLTYYVTGLISIGTWTWLTRRSPYNLLVSSIIWDVVYNAAWIGTTLWILRETSSPWQAVGACVVIIGLMMLGMGE